MSPELLLLDACRQDGELGVFKDHRYFKLVPYFHEERFEELRLSERQVIKTIWELERSGYLKKHKAPAHPTWYHKTYTTYRLTVKGELQLKGVSL